LVNIKKGSTSLCFTFSGGPMDDDLEIKILFTRYWWKRLSQRRRATRSRKKKAQLRKDMRQTARNLVEMMKESQDEHRNCPIC